MTKSYLRKMKLLIVAATENEIYPFLESGLHKSHLIDVLITGVGMVSTAYSLGKRISENKYTALLNVGIAGTFNENIALGSIVRVTEDCFSELGAEDDQTFLTLKDMGFGDIQFHENAGSLADFETIKSLPNLKGITVNKVHGNENSISKVLSQFSPDVESMEGAAVFYAAQQENLFALQIRSISNRVEKRNKENWNIPLAIKNLNDWLIPYITDYLKSTK